MSKKIATYLLFTALLFTGCSSEMTDDVTSDDSNVINVGGVETTGLDISVSTRAASSDKKPAEEIEWLLQPLFDGLDITYKKGDQSKIAVLKLLRKENNTEDGTTDEGGTTNKQYQTSTAGLAVYSFYNRDDNTGDETDHKAKWFDNGAHIFEGLYVPDRIQYHLNQGQGIPDETLESVETNSEKAPGITTDQHGDATEGTIGNYRLLEHYLGMPSNYTINATVGRITLPFHHRLSRVIAYILIDPSMGNAKIKGYTGAEGGTEDPSTSFIKFSNVWVLSGVKDSYDAGKKHHTFTPQWTKSRKVIPHFVGERGSYTSASEETADDFIMFYTDLENRKTYVFPTDDDWKILHTKYIDEKTKDSNLTKFTYNSTTYYFINYGKVPCYDLIVRPTYNKSVNNVMWDEELNSTITKDYLVNSFENNITFDITLDNELVYQKDFAFDLNANEQTIVYLQISREQVDYNSSGSELWVANTANDGYFGVNNQNGNTLSLAGSGWQRAYSNKESTYSITDGSKYEEDKEADHIEGEDGQYLTPETWKKAFFQATKYGKHHGDYFILEDDITIAAGEIPDNFVFTGHLDGRGHTITVTGAGGYAVTTNYSSTEPFYYIKKGDNNQYTKFIIGTGEGKTPLYVSKEEAHTKPRKAEGDPDTDPSIDKGGDGLVEANPMPSSLEDAMKDEYYIKNPDDSYTKIQDVTFYRVAPACLFCGIDGEYTTKQESGSSLPASEWEANVHKETWSSTYWVPFKGYRAEVLNTTVSGCRLIKDGATFKGSSTTGTFDVTGYILRSSGTEGEVSNDPGMPKY